MAYLGRTPSQAVRSRYYFTASGGETSLSGNDSSGNTLIFTDGNYVDVNLNGATLVAGSDYNTTTANTIAGLAALTASDVVEIVVYDTFSVFGGNVLGDFTISNGTLTAQAVSVSSLSTTGNITFGDDDKAVFGAGSDLEIYHDPSNNHSFIRESGTGDLRILGDNISFRSTSTDEPYINIATNGAVSLYYDNAAKLATTSTGVDVTGGVNITSPSNARALKMQNSANNSASQITFLSDDGTEDSFIRNQSSSSAVDTLSLGTGGSERMRISSSGELLINKTTNSIGTAGTAISSTLGVRAAVDGNIGLLINRLSSDGNLVDFRKDSSTVGAISSRDGVATNLILRTASGQGAGIGGANSGVLPCDENGLQDNEINLGASGTRWKDLYLSGKSFADSYQFAQNSSATGASEAIYRATTGTIAIKTNSSERMRITSAGDVGIGTTSPTFAAGGGVQLKGSGFTSFRATAGSSTGVDFAQFTDGIGYVYNRDNASLTFGTNNTSRMVIDANGIVTKQYQPAFLGFKASQLNNIPLSTLVDMSFATEVFDQNADFDGTTFTAPVSGRYMLSFSLRLHNVDTSASYYQAHLVTSNRDYRWTIDPNFAADLSYYTICLSVLADMDASDTAVVKLFQSGGTSQTDVHTESFFSGFLAC